jgi:hypothetical protein
VTETAPRPSGNSPAKARRRVDFPEPFGPVTSKHSPSRSAKERPDKTLRPPRSTAMFEASIRMDGDAPGLSSNFQRSGYRFAFRSRCFDRSTSTRNCDKTGIQSRYPIRPDRKQALAEEGFSPFDGEEERGSRRAPSSL